MTEQEQDEENTARDVIDNFGGKNDKQKNFVFQEGYCFLKTKSEKLKRHWMSVMGTELYCYREKNEP